MFIQEQSLGIYYNKGFDLLDFVKNKEIFQSMLKSAGLGVAMGNASDEIKLIADYISSSNDEDGVAKAIEKYIAW
ncbi:MAG: HAD hydrolase family protein [Tissierellaceae bacterium]